MQEKTQWYRLLGCDLCFSTMTTTASDCQTFFVGEAKTLQLVDTHQTALNFPSEIQSGARQF